jgi:hypothetical protein
MGLEGTAQIGLAVVRSNVNGKTRTKPYSCISSDSCLQITVSCQTVTSQHPNRGKKKPPAFIIKVTKRTFNE